jgi:TonB family protein
VGDGPADGFGLQAGRGGNGGSGSGNGSGSNTIGGSRGGKYGWYASQVQTKLVEAFKSNPKTRTASLQTEIRIWLDASGRIMRAKLSDSSGDAALDSAIQNEVLTGFKFPDAPPEGMPMPIVMKFSARRP